MVVSKCTGLTFGTAMSFLNAKISLVPKHQLVVPPTLLAPATHIRTDKATKIADMLTPLSNELFFQNNSITDSHKFIQFRTTKSKTIPSQVTHGSYRRVPTTSSNNSPKKVLIYPSEETMKVQQSTVWVVGKKQVVIVPEV